MRRRELIGLAVVLTIGLAFTDPVLAKSSIGIGGGELAPTAPAGGLFGTLFVQLTTWQREFFTSLRHALVDLRKDGSALPFLVGLSFVYGIFHAAGPGHGKAVISSYVIANRVQLMRGILICLASSLVQALSAIAIVGAGWFLLRGTSISMTAVADGVAIVSFALVAVFGGWLLARKLLPHVTRPGGRREPAGSAPSPARGSGFAGLAWASAGSLGRGPVAPSSFEDEVSALPTSRLPVSKPLRFNAAATTPGAASSVPPSRFRAASPGLPADLCTDDEAACGCGRSHMPDPAALDSTMTLGSAAAAVFAIGLRPCAGAVVVLTFALVNGLYLGGLLSVFAMALGTAITVSAIACFAVFARRSARTLSGTGARGRLLMSALEIGSALFMLVTGLVLLAAAVQAG